MNQVVCSHGWKKTMVSISQNEEIEVKMPEHYYEVLSEHRNNGYNVDAFTKKCWEIMLMQGFPKENFSMHLQWWLHNMYTENPNEIEKMLLDGTTHTKKISFEFFHGHEETGYSGKIKPFSGMNVPSLNVEEIND